MTKAEKATLLRDAAKQLRSQLSESAKGSFEPADSSSKVGSWDREYYIDIGTIGSPCSATIGLWIAEYGEDGREDDSKTRCWLGLEFSSLQGVKDFTHRVRELRPIQYYGPKTAALVRVRKGQQKRHISSWLSMDNLDKLGVERLDGDGYYYLGKYFREALSVDAPLPLKRLATFGKEILREAKAASKPLVKGLKTWSEKSLQLIQNRPDQRKFRNDLWNAYGKCAISGFNVKDSLIAAHIRPFKKENNQRLENGLLLRADLHMLFDANLITVRKSKGQYVVAVSKQIQKSGYFEFNGKPLAMKPENRGDWPCIERLEEHNSSLQARRG